MKLIQRLALASLFALALTPSVQAASYDFDDLDEIMPTFGWEETDGAGKGDDLMPTW